MGNNGRTAGSVRYPKILERILVQKLMSDLCRVRFFPSGKTVDVQPGTTLLSIFEKAEIPFELQCGGKQRCGKCKVRIESENLPYTPHPNISADELNNGIRLACNTIVDSDMDVYLLPRFYVNDTGVNINNNLEAISNSLKNRCKLTSLF